MITTKDNAVWHSSYEQNHYGDLFYSLVKIYHPQTIVELGTKAGYSAYHMARALRENGEGTIDCYDLFEKFAEFYGVQSTPKVVAESNLSEFKDIIRIRLTNAIGVEKKYKHVDLLHVDLENSAAVLEKVIPKWIDKVNKLIIIEGGSKDRDELDQQLDAIKIPVSDWITSFNSENGKVIKDLIPSSTNTKGQYVTLGGKPEYQNAHIFEWLRDFVSKRQDVEFFTFDPYPSLTILKKKV
jgi:hypothetical protein